MKTNNKDGKSTKKIARIINIFSVSWMIILFAAVMILRVKTSIPALLLYGCMGALYIGGLLGFQKGLENSRLKLEFEEANRECEEEEAKKSSADEKPDFFTLMAIAIFALIYSVSNAVNLVQNMISAHSADIPLSQYLPQFADTLTLLICCIFIGIIVFNVSRKRIFDRCNSICIYGVGAAIIFGHILQIQLMGDAPTADTDVLVYYSLLGIFIIFFGRLFDIAVKMKNEQDLTI
jgi:hypothetical protein